MIQILLLEFCQKVDVDAEFDEIIKRNFFTVLVRSQKEEEIRKFVWEAKKASYIPLIKAPYLNGCWEAIVKLCENELVATITTTRRSGTKWDALRGYKLKSRFIKVESETETEQERVLVEKQINKIPSEMMWRFSPDDKVSDYLEKRGAYHSEGELWIK